METSPLIFSVNQWTGFYIIRTSVIKEVIEFYISSDSTPIPEKKNSTATKSKAR